MHRHQMISNIKRKRGLLLLALPGLLLLSIFNYFPMFGIFIAFKDINFSKGIWGSDWVGIENFRFFFQSQDFFRITRNTLGLNLLFITLNLALALLTAFFLYEVGRGAVKVHQTVLFMPYLMSWVVVSYALHIFLHYDYGVLNTLLQTLGYNSTDWYGRPECWPAIMTVSYVWKNLGYSTIIFYTGLMGIDSSYYEAAAIDGASVLQQRIRIALPLLSPLIVLICMTQIGKIFYSDFGMFYILTKDSTKLYMSAVRISPQFCLG